MKKFTQNLRNNLEKPNIFQEDAFKITQPWNSLMLVHPSHCKIYVNKNKLKEQLFIYLKDDTCYDEVVHDVEKNV